MSELFSPIKLRDTEIKNRLWVAPMCQYSCDDSDGIVGAWHLRHYSTFAIGGFGMIITEATAVAPEGRITPFDAGIWNEQQSRAWQEIVAAVQAAGAKIAVQLQHAGRKGSSRAPWDPATPTAGPSVPLQDGGWQTLAPSAIAFPGYEEPRELKASELIEIVAAFRDAALRAVDAGFDAVEVHAAHGYLLHQFLSPLTNHRQDSYGGSLENRARLAVEVVEAIRSAVQIPIIVRVSATDWVEGGLQVDDFGEVGRWLRHAGADLIDVSSGANVPAQIPVGPAYQTPFATQIREEAGIPVSTVGLIDSAELADSIVPDRADVVLVARGALRDPLLPLRWAHQLKVENGPVWPKQYLRGAWV